VLRQGFCPMEVCDEKLHYGNTARPTFTEEPRWHIVSPRTNARKAAEYIMQLNVSKVALYGTTKRRRAAFDAGLAPIWRASKGTRLEISSNRLRNGDGLRGNRNRHSEPGGHPPSLDDSRRQSKVGKDSYGAGGQGGRPQIRPFPRRMAKGGWTGPRKGVVWRHALTASPGPGRVSRQLPPSGDRSSCQQSRGLSTFSPPGHSDRKVIGDGGDRGNNASAPPGLT